ATATYFVTSIASAQVDPVDTDSDGAASADASADTTTDDSVGTDEGSTVSEASADDGVVVAEGGGLFESGGADTSTTGDRQSDFSFDLGGYTRADVFVGVMPSASEPGIN